MFYCVILNLTYSLCEASLPKSDGTMCTRTSLAKNVNKGVVLVKKLTNCFEGIDINLGLVVLKFKKLNVSEMTIARESHRRNKYKRHTKKNFRFKIKGFEIG